MPEENNISSAANAAKDIVSPSGIAPEGSGAAGGLAGAVAGKALASSGPKVGTKVGMSKGEAKAADKNAESKENTGNSSPQQPRPGDKIGHGKKIGKNGKVEETASKKLVDGVGTGLTGYLLGPKAAQAGHMVAGGKVGDTLAEGIDKTPLRHATEALDKSGALDAGAGAIKGTVAAANGDVSGTVEGVKQVFKGIGKWMKLLFLITIIPALILFMAFFVIISPILSGYMTLSDSYNWSGTGEATDPSENEDEDDDTPVQVDIPASEAESLSKGSRSAKLAFLFPNGIPTTQAGMKPYLTSIQVKIRNANGNPTTISLTVHKKLVPNFQNAFNDIFNKTNFKITDAGVYNWRGNTSDKSKLSDHAYGAAVDINSNANPYCKPPTCHMANSEYAIPKSVQSIMKAHGFTWGGDWTSLKDFMHFSYTGN